MNQTIKPLLTHCHSVSKRSKRERRCWPCRFFQKMALGKDQIWTHGWGSSEQYAPPPPTLWRRMRGGRRCQARSRKVLSTDSGQREKPSSPSSHPIRRSWQRSLNGFLSWASLPQVRRPLVGGARLGSLASGRAWPAWGGWVFECSFLQKIQGTSCTPALLWGG